RAAFAENGTQPRPAGPAHALDAVGKPPPTQEFMYRDRTTVPVVIIDDDKAAVRNLVIKTIQTTAYARMPVTVDTQNSNRSDTGTVGGNGLVKPAFGKLGVSTKTELVPAAPHLFNRHPKVIVIERAVRVFSPLERHRPVNALRRLDPLKRIKQPD